LCAVLLSFICVVCARVSNAKADDFFGSSPGVLSSSHGKLDNADHCNDCHVNGSKALSNDKCLGCHDHDNLRQRIASGKGFHASSLVKGKACESCHLEHKGAGYDIMGWKNINGGEAKFNHDVAGWPLKGKHATTKCEDCHKARNGQGLRTYLGPIVEGAGEGWRLGNDKLCGPCHKNDQPHGFERKEMMACERCHGESVWKPAKSNQDFDHDDRKDASMPLLGSHKDVSCAKCHLKSKFNLPFAKADACGNSGCHASPHEGHLFGKNACELCHSPTFKTLKQQNFDHEERTHFPLGQAHNKMKCYECHTKALGEAKPSGACEQCHAKDNKHGNRFAEFGTPSKCGVCHPSVNWKPTAFNHTKNTKFTLTAKHAQVNCRACHRGKGPAEFEKFESGKVGCIGCHEHSNVHAKKFNDGQCLGCHFKPGTIEVKREDMIKVYHGPKSNFPLVKAHKSVACGECHPQGKFTPPPAKECGERCHKDSLHKGSLGEECSRCHVSGTWDALAFTHDEDTKWPLQGEHKKNKCEDCHPTREFTGTPKNCSAQGCHADDDVHKGRLGDKCERCHLETGDNKFNHNTMSSFALEGKHLNVRCTDCHPSQTFKPRPVTCFGCHPEPNIHKGQYSTECEQCHNTKTFADVKPLHDVGDFSLTGAHNNIACERCHRDGDSRFERSLARFTSRPLQGAGNMCINCHRQDDIHNNALSPRCGECHTQWSFAPARFDHTRVGCNLVGLHRTLPCADCHKSGSYAGTAGTCVSCHRDDALRAGTGLSSSHGGGGTTCANCHTMSNWKAATGSFGRESVCR
jgi:hypothetical protein